MLSVGQEFSWVFFEVWDPRWDCSQAVAGARVISKASILTWLGVGWAGKAQIAGPFWTSFSISVSSSHIFYPSGGSELQKACILREWARWELYCLFCPSLGNQAALPFFVAWGGYKSLPHFRGKEHKAQFLMEEYRTLRQLRVMGFILVQLSLENTSYHLNFSWLLYPHLL